MLAYFLLLTKMRVVSTLTLSFAYSRSLILINLNDERKIMVKNDYPGVLGGVRLIRQTLLSYDNVSLIPNYPVGSKLLSLNKHIRVM